MSSFDLSRIVEALQSPKIKSRNDALALLDGFAVTKLRLSASQLASLVSALIKAIDIERDACLKSNANQATIRASSASSFLRDLVQDSLKKDHLLKERLKLKTCQTLIGGLVSLYYISSYQPFMACAGNFAKILCLLFETSYVFTHLAADVWLKSYHFLLQAIAYELEIAAQGTMNENLLCDLFSALYALIGGSLVFGLSPLLRDKTYFPMFTLLKKTLGHFNKRESPVLVTAFKIINNLLIALSTEDVGFSHQLIGIGITSALRFSSSAVSSFVEQLLIFLNLDAFHKYISLKKLPKLTSVLPIDLHDNSALVEDPEVTVYNLEMLIYALLHRGLSPGITLNVEDVGIQDTERAVDWYQLPKMYLMTANRTPWLLVSAISKLTSSFYKINGALQNDRSLQDFGNNQLCRAKKSYSSNFFKRQKLSERHFDLRGVESPTQFYNTLLASEDVKVQTCGLQILAFHFELCYYPHHIGHYELEKSLFTATPTDNEVTVMDPDFSTSVGVPPDIAHTISLAAKFLADRKQSFWALIACRSLLKRTVFDVVSTKDNFRSNIYLMMKLLLDLIRDPSVSSIACSVFTSIVDAQSPTGLQVLIDKTVMTQLGTMVELSAILGPAWIDDPAFQFWQAVVRVHGALGQSKKHRISDGLSKWLLEKWSTTASKLSISKIREASEIALLVILWLGGHHIPSIASPPSHLVPDPFFQAMKEGEQLQQLIAMEEAAIPMTGFKHELPVLDKSIEAIDSIVVFLCKEARLCVSEGNLEYAMSLAMSLVNVYVTIRNYIPTSGASLEETARNLILNVTPQIRLKDQATSVLEILMQFDPQEEALLDVAFPSEILEYHFRYAKNTHTLQVDLASDLDGEFSNHNATSRSSPTPDNLDREFHEQCLYFKYLAKYEILNPNNCIKHIAHAPINLISQCLTSYMDSVKRQDLNKTMGAGLVRLIGEKFLSVQDYDRLDAMIALACRVLEKVLPTYRIDLDSEFHKDTVDVVAFFFQCVEKDLLMSLVAQLNIWKMLLQYTGYNDESFISNSDLTSVFLTHMLKFSNKMRIGVVRNLHQVLAKVGNLSQTLFLERILHAFTSPQSSVESCATFCMFCSYLTKGLHIDVPVLNYLMKFAGFDFFTPFIGICVNQMATNQEFDNPKRYFEDVRLNVLISWWTQGQDFLSFPCVMFGFRNLNEFLCDNSRQITAIMIAIKSKKISVSNESLGSIAAAKDTDLQMLILDSLPLIIALSHSPQGIRGEIFMSLKEYLNRYQNDVLAKLPLIVLEVIKLTDTQSELRLRNAIGNNALTSFLKSSEITGNSSQNVIEPNSSLEIIKVLIKTFWPVEAGNFWSLQLVYFFLRNIGLASISSSQIALKGVARRIQYVLCLSGMQLSDFHLIKVATKICLALARNGLFEDIKPIVDQMNLETCVYHHIDQVLPMIFEVLATIFTVQCKGLEAFSGFLSSLERLLISEDGHFGSSRIIIECSLRAIHKCAFEIELSDIESFLHGKDLGKLYRRFSDDLFVVISKLTPNVRIDFTQSNSSRLATIFLNHRNVSDFDDDFKIWMTEYLAEFHLSGTAFQTLNDALQFDEYLGLDKNDYTERSKTIEPFMQSITQRLEYCSYEESTFLESIIGVFIHKYKTRKRDITLVLTFESFYESFNAYILPLDLYSCVLLNSIDIDSFDSGPSIEAFANDFQQIQNSLSFQAWTCQLLLALLQEVSRLSSIAPVLASCVIKLPDIAQDVLPNMFCFYLHIMGENAIENIIKIFNGFWENFKKPYDQNGIVLLKNIVISLRIGAMLDIDLFKRCYGMMNHEAFFFIIREGFLPKSALMVFEDSMAGKSKGEWKKHSDTLAGLYISLDDEDLLMGIPADKTIESALRIRGDFVSSAERLRYSSGLLDADYALNKTPLPQSVIQSLLDEGFFGASKLLNQQLDLPMPSEWSWKLSQWDLPVDDNSSNAQDTTFAYFKQLRENPSELDINYRSSMLKIVSGRPGYENHRMHARESIRATERWLDSLALIKSAKAIMDTSPENFAAEINMFRNTTKWFEKADTRYFENILLGRRIAFSLHSSLQVKAENHLFILSECLATEDLCRQGEVCEVVRYNNLLRSGNSLQKIVSSSILLEKLVEKSQFMEVQPQLRRLSSFQMAQTLWVDGKMDVSVALLKKLANDGDIVLPVTSLNVSAMSIKAQLAVWLAESRLDLGSNILDQVVNPMKSEIGMVEDAQQQSKIYHHLAHFCESQYKSNIIKDQLSDLEARVSAMKEEIQEIRTHYGKSEVLASERNAARKYYEELKSLIKSETLELSDLRALKVNFAHNAVRFYLKVLLIGDASDEDLDKFFSLFLELSGDEKLQSLIQEDIYRLLSHKPLAWCTQILSRVSNDNSSFQESIQRLIFKMCHDHPFQSLYYLTSLLLHEKLASETINAAMTSRIIAAKKVKTKLQSSSPVFAAAILLPIERLCLECVSLAEMKVPKGRNLLLDKIKTGTYWLAELPPIPPPTLEIPISSSGYANVPTMTKMSLKVDIASSGISLPKVVTIFLSNGTKHKMLLKHGTDDLRQDAIMEQVFEKVNKIFREDPETRKRKLRVRTYSAVPLGPKAGVIEFVPDSKALFDVILPYHRANDLMKYERARELMKDCQTKELGERLKTYQSILTKITPVLRLYFLRNFVTPDAWFASRQCYVRGVATSSIVGHILGLGDRHCNNILLDEYTGEPIHIDLGVAFDQGKRLKIPETVPFRLTRDIVDGFGFMGTEGSFSKVSEHTFRVLRESKDHILAILDVLRWDPLYSWSISPIRKRRLQELNTGMLHTEAKPDGSAAGKAIIGVSDKLNAGGLSVEAAVRELIRQATSEKNLAVIYCGWCSFF